MTTLAAMPWLWPYGGDAAWLAKPTDAGEVSRCLNALRDGLGQQTPLFSVSNETLGALDYERCVHRGHIPTRDLSHDWYNGHVWLAFPETKQLINALHIEDASCLQSDPNLGLSSNIHSANGRSRLRDSLTLFDESGALFLSTDQRLIDALLVHDWQTLFVMQRETWAQRARLLVFGHGLLDSMHKPHKGLCSKAVPVLVSSLDLSPAELRVLVRGTVEKLCDPGQLSPLPVMGIPGWFSESETPGFYHDSTVYRTKPTRRGSVQRERLALAWDGSTLRGGKCAGQSLPEFQGEESPDSSEHGAG